MHSHFDIFSDIKTGLILAKITPEFSAIRNGNKEKKKKKNQVAIA